MKYRRYLLILLFNLVISFSINSYVGKIGDYGENIHWNSSHPDLLMRVNSSNRQGLSEPSLQTIVGEAMTEWNSASGRATVRKINVTYAENIGSNNLFFSDDPSYFSGSAVLGVTVIAYEVNTGNIIKGDIIIKDSPLLSLEKTSEFYVGGLVTHELGHFLGLDHSQVHGATMFYVSTTGQHTLADDDSAGIYSKYPDSEDRGSIIGTVIGSVALTGVLGASVEAYSVEDGKVLGAAVSSEDGTFIIKGLKLDRTYLLYISPLEAISSVEGQSSLSIYYSTRRKDFCSSHGNYIGSFYYECDSLRKGFPKGTLLSKAKPSAAVGNISIRCDVSVSDEYLSNKGGGTVDLNVVDKLNHSVGDSFVGFFTSYQAENSMADHLEIDLSDYVVTQTNHYLEIRLASQKFFSPLKLTMTVNPGGVSFPVIGNYETVDYSANIDVIARVPLSLNPTENVFTIDVTPEDLDQFLTRIGQESKFIFPASGDFLQDERFYLITFIVVKDEAGVVSKVSEKQYDNQRDNSLCAQAPNTYAVKAGSTIKKDGEEPSVNRRNSSFACMTIDVSGGDDNPPTNSLAVLFFGMMLAWSLISVLLNRNKC